MIQRITEPDENFALELLKQNKFQNLYLYIDAVAYGFSGENIESYFVKNCAETYAMIYIYYGSVQLLEVSSLTEDLTEEIASFILQKDYRRVSGTSSMIQQLHQALEHCFEITSGYIMKYNDSKPYPFENTYFATEIDFREIAQLICTDPGMGSSYNVQGLYTQLLNRFKNDGCENLCIKKDGRIVSHFATYALANDIAVLSGMITKTEYRGMGLGSQLVKQLSSHVLCSGRTPILYCYEDEYYTWYQKLGYETIGQCSKLVKK